METRGKLRTKCAVVSGQVSDDCFSYQVGATQVIYSCEVLSLLIWRHRRVFFRPVLADTSRDVDAPTSVVDQ